MIEIIANNAGVFVVLGIMATGAIIVAVQVVKMSIHSANSQTRQELERENKSLKDEGL